MVLRICVISFLSFVIQANTNAKEEKRILLNDPGYYESRISHLESLTQQLIINNSALESKQQQLMVKNNAIESQQQQLIVKNQALESQQQQLIVENNAMEAQLKAIQSQKDNAFFIHWGRKTCYNQTAETIYSGFTASGYYNEKGTGVDYLCLPRDPQFTNRSAAAHAGTGVDYLHGAEFESNFFADDSLDEDVPCAACESSSATLMIPGRTSCYQGWTEQYSGYLATSYHLALSQRNYICVDKHPEYLFSGSKNSNGALLYPVRYSCSTLQCPPYKEGEAATCVVCSK